jgi:hypothetical protein
VYEALSARWEGGDMFVVEEQTLGDFSQHQ